jgi:hypothetical protein
MITILAQTLTIYHVFNRLWIILGEIDDASVSLSEETTTCAIEETGSQTDNCAVYGPSLVAAFYCQI